jgi:hypothetical protein
MVHLKGEPRHKYNLNFCKNFIKQHKEAGKRIFRYEWKHWKRILQKSRKHRWRNRQMRSKEVVNTVFREYEYNLIDWTAIVGNVVVPRHVVAHTQSALEQLENEWLECTLFPNTTYTCAFPVESPSPDGVMVTVDTTLIFKVISVVTPQRRPHLMQTFSAADNVVLSSPLALNVQHYDSWEGRAAPPGTLFVYPESDAEWVQPLRLCPFRYLQATLQKWMEVVPVDDAPCVLQLSSPARAEPVYPLEDERCPVLILGKALLDRGWHSEQKHIVHVAAAPATYDSRFCLRMKYYYRVLLLDLGKRLCLAGGSIPSQQPQGFYRLLLAGVECRPGDTAKNYLALLNRGRQTKGLVPLELPPHEDDPPPITDGVGGGSTLLPLPGELPPPPPPRPGKVAGGRRRQSGRGRGRGVVPLPVPPRVDAPVLAPPPAPPAPAPPPIIREPTVLLPAMDDAPRDAEEPAAKRQKLLVLYVDGLDGAKIRYQPYTPPGSTVEYRNYRLACYKCGNRSCGKKRGSNYTTHFGDIEPLAYLQAWQLEDWRAAGKKTHALHNPPDEVVAAYALAHGDELRAVLASLG